MARGHQLTRQWQLLQLLDRAPGVSVDDAAGTLGCTVRTIWRDLRVLQDAGFPIYDEANADGRRSVWKVEESFRRQLPLKLSLAELSALVMARELLTPTGVLDGAIASGFDKIAGVLSKEALALLDRMRLTVGVRTLGAKLQSPAATHLAAIQQALLERRSLRVRYYSMSRDAIDERTIDPHHLTLHGGGFYVVAHCHLRNALRIFAVERVRECELTAARFEPAHGFDAEAYLAGAWGILRGDVVTVKVRFAGTLARYIRERLWHPTQTFRDLADGRLEVTMRVADTLEVRRWILGFGSEAEVLEPAALREALRREAEAMARMLLPTRRLPVEVAPDAMKARDRGSAEGRPAAR